MGQETISATAKTAASATAGQLSGAAPRSTGGSALDPAAALAHAVATKRPTIVFIVTSTRPQVGKTFAARLLIDFLRREHEPVAYDLNASGDALTDYLPELAIGADIGDIRGQMALFDSLIVDDGITKVVDLGNASFAQFFAIAEKIGFIKEALRRSIELVVLFAADAHPVAVRAYADLRLRGAVVIPVFNEAILKGRTLREQYPFTRATAAPLQIPELVPVLKEQIETFRYSFIDFQDRLPLAIPAEIALELRAWTRRVFLEFRELELRLLLAKVRTSAPQSRS
jgi:hypothetical protein